MDLLPLIKSLLELIIAPFLGLVIWFVKGYTDSVKSIEKRVTLLEKDTAKDVAVILTKLENLNQKADRIEKLLERP